MAGNINYSAVLADLEQKRDELDSAITAIRLIVAAGGGPSGADTASGGTFDPENIPVGSFLRLTIVDAVKKLLDMTKSKLGIPQIAKALERGGLPPAKPNTIYAVLRRRENEVGDLIRFGDEWALAEWYPNNPNLRKQRVAKEAQNKKGKAKSAGMAKAKPPKKKPANPSSIRPRAEAVATPPPTNIKTHEAAEQILKQVGTSLDLATITELVNSGFGKKLNANFTKGLLANDPKKRFVDLGSDVWDLKDRTE